MEHVHSLQQGLWLRARELNVVSSLEERVGVAPVNLRNMEEFHSTMFNRGLASVAFDGSPFTWKNKIVW